MATNAYYRDCLNAGLRLMVDKELEVKYRDEIEVDNKAEVAKGLVQPKAIEKGASLNEKRTSAVKLTSIISRKTAARLCSTPTMN